MLVWQNNGLILVLSVTTTLLLGILFYPYSSIMFFQPVKGIAVARVHFSLTGSNWTTELLTINPFISLGFPEEFVFQRVYLPDNQKHQRETLRLRTDICGWYALQTTSQSVSSLHHFEQSSFLLEIFCKWIYLWLKGKRSCFLLDMTQWSWEPKGLFFLCLGQKH